NLSEVCTRHSEDLRHFHRLLYQPGRHHFRYRLMVEHEATDPDLLLIGYLALHPRWRGRQLGLWAVRKLVDVVGDGCGLAVAIIGPRVPGGVGLPGVPDEWLPEQPDSAVWYANVVKLRRYFRTMGFRRLRRTWYYLLPLNRVTPTATELLAGPMREP